MSEHQIHSELNDKIGDVFGRLAIDKRRLLGSQLSKRGVPAYVAEWVLETVVPGMGPLTASESQRLQEWVGRVLPGPSEQNVIKHRISQGETVRILTPVQAEVDLRRKNKPAHFAKMSLIGIDDSYIGASLLDQYPDLLRQGMWGVVDIVGNVEGPIVTAFKPMQATVNLELFKKARSEFSLEEWHWLLLTSMGYAPEAFSEEERLLLLCRLLPLVEKNMHLMELAPKGTGKSYIYENINPRVRLISGGNVSPAVLFVNNSSGQWGLLARFAVVVLDEVQTLRFEKPEEVIGALKGYLANGKITRGGLHETASECGMVLLANIGLDDEMRPLCEVVVEELPELLRETAFLDRIKGILPGWKLPKLSGKLLVGLDSEFSVGLKSDFFGDVLLALRNDMAPNQYCVQHLQLKGNKPYRRNEDSIHSLASGLMKIQFPDGEMEPDQFHRFCVKPAIELRQLVWDQLYALDLEYHQWGHYLEVQ